MGVTYERHDGPVYTFRMGSKHARWGDDYTAVVNAEPTGPDRVYVYALAGEAGYGNLRETVRILKEDLGYTHVEWITKGANAMDYSVDMKVTIKDEEFTKLWQGFTTKEELERYEAAILLAIMGLQGDKK